jgi:hypothetical protein
MACFDLDSFRWGRTKMTKDGLHAPEAAATLPRYVLAVVFALIVAQPLHADGLEFWGIFTGGTLSYTGGVTPYSETTTPDTIGSPGLGIGPPGSPRFTCVPCEVNMQTGNFTGNDSKNYYFDGGGSITINSGVYPLGSISNAIIPAGTTLLTGSFLSADVFVPHPGSPVEPGQYTIFTGEFLGTVDHDLLGLFGLPDGLYLGTVETQSIAVGGVSPPLLQPTPPEPFSSGSATDFAVITLTPVPEPYSLELLATVFAVFGVIFRSRLRRRLQ